MNLMSYFLEPIRPTTSGQNQEEGNTHKLSPKKAHNHTDAVLSSLMVEHSLNPTLETPRLKQILVVDDGLLNIRLINMLFKGTIYESKIVTSLHPDDAWEKLNNEDYQFSIVFTDEHMPDKQGSDLALLIKMKWPKMPVISISSEANHLFLNNPTVFDGAVQKPWKRKSLVDIIEKFFPNNLN